jgi:hypothetical protein
LIIKIYYDVNTKVKNLYEKIIKINDYNFKIMALNHESIIFKIIIKKVTDEHMNIILDLFEDYKFEFLFGGD